MSNTKAVLESARPKHSTIGTAIMLVSLFGSIALMLISAEKLVRYNVIGYDNRTEMTEQFWDFGPWVAAAIVLFIIGQVFFSKIPKKYDKDIAPYHEKLKSVMEQELKEQYQIEKIKFDETYDWDKKLVDDTEQGVYTVVHFKTPQTSGDYTVYLENNGSINLMKDEREASQHSPDPEMHRKE